MKWVTKSRIHLDRVVTPWLILRFIDKDAEFLFVSADARPPWPGGAIPFALPGAELGKHDDEGSTFRKAMRKYKLDDPALEYMLPIVESGIHQALHEGRADEFDVPAVDGIGVNALTQGMMLISTSDAENVERSMVLYDALYAYSWTKVMASRDPSLAKSNLMERNAALKPLFKGIGADGRNTTEEKT
ncbi:MAG TPA: chromate resistance protein ChrB domain-containing protein [Ramlibacter sp.]|nr:chromate resistance protein ChrB domain-containing protein [Ramlibacter sp.]